MGYRDPAVGRARDRERFRKRAAERCAAGLCPRCGRRPPAPGRSVCERCAEKKRVAGRARDARLRAAGKPRRNLAKARAHERERARRQTAERRAAGLCTRCGQAQAASKRAVCESCGDRSREAERIGYAKARADGKPYGGRDPGAKRRSARAASRKRQHVRCDAGQCLRCGKRPPAEGGTTCEPCREARQAAERARYTERRAAGLCGKCGAPTFDGESRCAPCATLDGPRQARKNAAAKKRYAARRAAGRCTDCGAPSQGAARCQGCAERSYHRSDHFRGIPVWPARFTVIELATETCHGTFDSEAEAEACLAFAKLSRDQVEIVPDTSPMAGLTGWT